MKQILKRTMILVSLSLFPFFISCSSEYDLTKIDTTVEVLSKELVLPIGSTDSIKVSDFISDLNLDVLKKNADGEYAFMQSDKFDFSENIPDLSTLKMDAQHITQDIQQSLPDIGAEFSIDGMTVDQTEYLSFGDITLDDIQIPSVAFDKSLSLNKGVTIPPVSGVDIPIDLPVSFQEQAPIIMPDYTLPEQISTVKQVNFTPGSKLVLTLNKKGMNDVNININTFKIKFPKELVVAEADPDNSVTIPAQAIPASGFQKVFTIQALDFTKSTLPEGKIGFNSQIDVDLNVNISTVVNSSTDPSQWALDLSFLSQMAIDNSVAVIRDIDIPLPDGIEDYQKIELTGLTEDYGVFEVVPEGNPKFELEIGMPKVKGLNLVTLPEGIRIDLPDFMKLSDIPASCIYDAEKSVVTIKGIVPERLSFVIDKLQVDPLIENEKFYIVSNFKVDGGVRLEGGDLNSDDLISLNNQPVSFKVTVPPLTPKTVSITEFHYDFEDEFNFDMSITEGMEYISRINSVTLENAILGFKLEMMKPYVDFGADLHLDIEVSFPDLLMFDDPRIEEVEINGEKRRVLKISEVLTPGGSLGMEDLKIKGLELNRDIDNILEISELVKVKAHLNVQNPTLDLSTLEAVNLRATVDVSEARLGNFEGKVKFSIDPVEQEVVLGELPEMLQGDDVVLDVANPILKMGLRTNIGLPIEGLLSIIPYVGGNPVPGAAIEDLRIVLPAADPDKDVTETRYWIGPKESMPEGYIFVDANLAGLIRKFPESIKIIFNANVDNSVIHTVNFTNRFVADMDYALEAPLKFGKDFHIPIEQKIEGLPEDIMDLMSQILEKETVVKILAKATSNVPLKLEMLLETLDRMDQPTPIKAGPATIKSCDAEGNAVTSEFELVLDARGVKDLPAIASLLVKLDALSGGTMVTHVGITEDTFVKLELALKVEGGIEVDLKELANN